MKEHGTRFYDDLAWDKAVSERLSLDIIGYFTMLEFKNGVWKLDFWK